MKATRVLVGLVGMLLAGSAVGHRSAAAAAAPSVNIRRVAFATTLVFPGDFNGDGIPDLVSTQPWVDGPPPAVIALGRGDGTYGAATSINCFCRILAVADLNHDGKLDLVVEEEPEPDVTIFALRGKAGVMFRNTPFTAVPPHVDAIVTPSKGVAMQDRAIAGGTSAGAGTLPGVAPGWLKLQRRGSAFTSFWSSDGVHFTQIGSVSVTMNDGVSVGLAVTSHNAVTPATATFDSVTIQQP